MPVACCRDIKAAHGTPLGYRLGELQQGPCLGFDAGLGAKFSACHRCHFYQRLTGTPFVRHRQARRSLRGPMVPEDRLTGTGRQIPLRVVVVPASGGSPRRPDRLGGRGDRAIRL